MKMILSFIISFCIITACLGALYLICPSGKLEKSVRYVFILIMLLGFVLTVKGMEKLELPDITASKESRLEDFSSLGAKLNFEQALKNAGLNFTKVEVYTNKDASGSIFISEVRIYSDENEEKIKSIIKDGEKYEVTVVNE